MMAVFLRGRGGILYIVLKGSDVSLIVSLKCRQHIRPNFWNSP